MEPLENADWLTDETTADSKAVTLPPLELNEIVPRGARPHDEKRWELAVALRALPLIQRIYLNALMECGFVREVARKKVAEKIGATPGRNSVYQWEKSQRFVRAMALATEHARTFLDPQTNLLRLNTVIESTLTPRDRYAGGERTGEQEIAAGEALRGIELAAKISGQMRDDSIAGNRVTVIINLADDKPEGAVVSEQ